MKPRPSFSKVDLLYLNAQAVTQDMLVTPDGHEYTHQVNYLSHFYIVHQMLARGLLAPDARIIITQTEDVLSGSKRSWPGTEMLLDPAAALKRAAGEPIDQLSAIPVGQLLMSTPPRAQGCRKQQRLKQ